MILKVFTFGHRAIGGIADVAAWAAVGGILMKIFPNLVARIMSFTNMCFGFGYMIGKVTWYIG